MAWFFWKSPLFCCTAYLSLSPLYSWSVPAWTTGCMVTLTVRVILGVWTWDYLHGDTRDKGKNWDPNARNEISMWTSWGSHDGTWRIGDHSPPDCLWAAKGRPEGLGIHVLTQQWQPQFVEIELMREALAAPACFSSSWGSPSDSGLASAANRPALPGLPARSRKWEQGL